MNGIKLSEIKGYVEAMPQKIKPEDAWVSKALISARNSLVTKAASVRIVIEKEELLKVMGWEQSTRFMDDMAKRIIANSSSFLTLTKSTDKVEVEK